jgi:hypothetical protein
VTAQDEELPDSVLPLAQRLAAYPELWQVVYRQAQQPHYLANFVATLQPIAIARFTATERENSTPPLGFLTGVLYFEIALVLDSYTTGIEDLVDVFLNAGLPADAEGGVLLAPGMPLAVARRVMAEPIEAGDHSHIVIDFYAHVIDICNNQRQSARRQSRFTAAVTGWMRRKLSRKVTSLEQHRIVWEPDEVDHIQALAHWQRAIHASSLGLSDSARIDFARCASVAAAAQARRATLLWPTECLAATRAVDGVLDGAGGDFMKALGQYVQSPSLIPFAYNVSRR